MFFVNLVNGFHEKGYAPVVALLSQHNPLLNKLNHQIPYHIIKRRFRFDLSVSEKIKSIIDDEKINKVFCVELFSFFLSKRLYLFNKNVSFYLSVHNSIPITKKAHILDLIYLRFFQNKDKVIYVCNFQKKCYRNKYFFSPKQSYVIYNGINLIHYSRDTTFKEADKELMSWKKQLGLTDQDKTIVITGRLAQEKGHLYAIKALSFLHKSLENPAHLIIVGGGTREFESLLFEASNNSGIASHIHFLGSQKDVRPFLYFADLFTLTSFSETFSIAALEALSMGVPCCLTAVGGSPEMVINEKIGQLCESKNYISIANSWNIQLSNKTDQQYIRNYTTEYFSFQKMLDSYIEVLD